MLLMSVLRSEVKSLMTLLAVVSARGDNRRLPWVELVIEDMRILARYHGGRLEELGNPRENAAKWQRFITDHPGAWRQLVAELHFFDSPLDAAATSKHTSSLGHFNEHICVACLETGCPAIFVSEKALMCHQRSKHGQRNPLRIYLDGSGVCPVCRAQFGSRTRALAHASERRHRGKTSVTCRSVLEAGGIAPLSADRVAALDAADGKCRREARKQGHTQPVVEVPAKRSRVRGAPDDHTYFWELRPAKRLRGKTPAAEVLSVAVKRQRHL
jgi:hypothetical protein